MPDAGADLIFYPRAHAWRLRSGDVVLFLDLPATAGAPLWDVLAGGFAVDEIRASARWPRDLDDVGRIAADVRGGSLIRARVDYEFYRFLPRTPVYVTVLRDPVERIVALYDAVRATPEHPGHQRVTSGRLSLHDFVCDPAFARDVVDAQARCLAGVTFREPGDVPDGALLQVAQANLGEFALWGLAERLVESVHLLAYTFGWPFLARLDLATLAPPPSRRHELAPATLEAIERRTSVDSALMRFARAQLDQRVRAGLLDLLEQNARARGPHLSVLGELEDLRRERERLEAAWSWRTAERLKAWRQAIAPAGSRRDRVYQRLGVRVFGRGTSSS